MGDSVSFFVTAHEPAPTNLGEYMRVGRDYHFLSMRVQMSKDKFWYELAYYDPDPSEGKGVMRKVGIGSKDDWVSFIPMWNENSWLSWSTDAQVRGVLFGQGDIENTTLLYLLNCVSGEIIK